MLSSKLFLRKIKCRGNDRGCSEAVSTGPMSKGLRLDEAMHPLTLLAVRSLRQTSADQNGAPLRLVVPWKYGFKGIKRSSPRSDYLRNRPSPPGKSCRSAYGFFANVNPAVEHPRWSQATERRIGEPGNPFFGQGTRATLMFNGYADQVAQMYAGMDLRKNY